VPGRDLLRGTSAAVLAAQSETSVMCRGAAAAGSSEHRSTTLPPLQLLVLLRMRGIKIEGLRLPLSCCPSPPSVG
jgi:hypothetical protein